MRTGLIVGIDGHALDQRSRDVLMHPAVVGVILFSRNYNGSGQLVALCEEIRGLRDPRLLICVDQEGGRVQRFRSGFTALPALGELGRWYRSHPDRALDLAYRHGRVMAAEVLGHGADLSLAPVLDLDRGSEVIGDRA
ncbi:MAG TPA: glycoside hydrolase family 3 N-terminal domain-containing protein, partial [Wenzhouxiangellaceae bacterium]|nr:glycoside hydrolase family 3 N-terminal domain-containing protein [Wenzhouxiangellaceae bacterium]